jgi:hypothetical protein
LPSGQGGAHFLAQRASSSSFHFEARSCSIPVIAAVWAGRAASVGRGPLCCVRVTQLARAVTSARVSGRVSRPWQGDPVGEAGRAPDQLLAGDSSRRPRCAARRCS